MTAPLSRRDALQAWFEQVDEVLDEAQRAADPDRRRDDGLQEDAA